MKAGTKRLNLDITHEVRERIRQIRKLTGAATTSEVIRTALSAYDALIHAAAAGHQIIVRRTDGTEATVIMLAVQAALAPHEAKTGSCREALKNAYEAGGHAWDNVPDPDAAIREMRDG